MSESTKVEEVFVPIPLDELTFIWLENGAPLFYANQKDIQKHIEAHGFTIYYLIGTVHESIKNGNVTSVIKRNGVFKVVNTMVGKTISEVSDLPLDEVKPTAFFALPKIPHSLVKTLDAFFRYVDTKHGTESIVLLTFDTTKTDSTGWGFLVPEQENTGTDCDYEPESIAGEKPPHVMIVGSAHSHPGMQAYASAADHKDQASFDGIHITYGWLKSKNNVTEYHIELQMQGESYEYEPHQIFGNEPVDLPDDEVKELAERVKKKSYSHATSSTGGMGSNPNKFPGSSSNGGQFSGITTGGWTGTRVTLPAGAPDPAATTIVGVLKGDTEIACPFCKTKLIKPDYDSRRCLACRMYLATPGESLNDLVKFRQDQGVHSNEIDPAQQPYKNIVFWVRNDSGTDEFNEVYAPSVDTKENLGK